MSNVSEDELQKIEGGISNLVKMRSNSLEEQKKWKIRIVETEREITILSGKILTNMCNNDESLLKIKSLSESRRKKIIKIDSIRKEFGEINIKINKLNRGISRESVTNLRKESENIEWAIQTEKLSRNDERELIDRIRNIEKDISAITKVNLIRQRLDYLVHKVGKLEEEVKQTFVNKDSVVLLLEKRREELSHMLNTKSELYQKINSLWKYIDKYGREINSLNNELNDLIRYRKSIEKSRRSQEYEARLVKEEQLFKEARKTAKDKISKGLKISLEEFKLTMNEEIGET